MAWWSRGRRPRTEVRVVAPALTAAAAIRDTRRRLTPTAIPWQEEVWAYYADIGEFRFAVDWLANAMSRVRLRAARVTPDQDEPELVDDGPAAELVYALGGDVAGRAQLMARFAQLLTIPGESYLVGEGGGSSQQLWQVVSTDEIRQRSGVMEIIDAETSENDVINWRQLDDDHLVVRIWRPHARYRHVADAAARSARRTMRELELINLKIQAQYLSRLASAGIIIFPDEVTFPVRDEFEDAPDPFMAEWLETAKTAIQNPGTASGIVPIPMRVPGEYVDKIRYIDFTHELDRDEVAKRESAIRRLASQLDLPAEVMLGMGDMTHWNAWQLDETAIKLHIAPPVELVCQGLTRGYLTPSLEAADALDEDVRYVVWYDPSELTLRPDRSSNALQVYDRHELSGDALRRETGFDPGDAPTRTELTDQVLKSLLGGQLAAAAFEQLTGTKLVTDGPTTDEVSTQAPEVSGGAPGNEPGPPSDGAAPTPDRSTEEPPVQTAVVEDRVVLIGLKPSDARGHMLETDVTGTWYVRHGDACAYGGATGCPVNLAATRIGDVHPGTPGVYELVASNGRLVMTHRVYDDASDPGPRARVR